jgi:transmembrane sensor
MNRPTIAESESATSIAEQASNWWFLLSEGNASWEDRRAFREWLARGPERVEAFLQTAQLSKALESKKLRWPTTSVDDLVKEALTAPINITPMTRPAQSLRRLAERPTHAGRRTRGLSIAAMLCVFSMVCWWALTGPQRYETGIGEQRSILLGDGSVVTLNTSSVMRVQLSKQSRRIELLAGEALFQVAHDKVRPFDVIAGNTVVRAVGTQFDVDRKDGATVVTVVEGRVSVANEAEAGAPRTSADERSIPLDAGERVTVTQHSRSKPITANLGVAIAWTQRRLVFDRQSLAQVAVEFNRYNRRSIQIADGALRDEEVTGNFQANDPDSFVDFLAKIPGVVIQREADRINVTMAR